MLANHISNVQLFHSFKNPTSFVSNISKYDQNGCVYPVLVKILEEYLFSNDVHFNFQATSVHRFDFSKLTFRVGKWERERKKEDNKQVVR